MPFILYLRLERGDKMENPIIAQKGSYKIELEKGKHYMICACGASKNQPFCDQKGHVGSSFKPILYTAEKDGMHYICGCKHAKTMPLCDGTHKTL
jgi:CDGSH iron-sulfur domain-containing protein 3